MQKCPVCGTVEEKESQDYCLVCAWEFEYYFDELSEEERNRYEYRLNLYSTIYQKSVLKKKVKYKEKIRFSNTFRESQYPYI